MSYHNLLHTPRKDEPKEVVMSAPNLISTPRAYLKVIPVELTGPKESIKTYYALLDEGSIITLVDSTIAKDIGAEGNVQPFTIKCVTSAYIDAHNSSKIEVQIRGMYHNRNHKMTAHTMDRSSLLPQIVSKSNITQCRYLQEIEGQLVLDRATPNVLIGQDNWNLIVSRTINIGPRERPVASLTELGWVLHEVDKYRKQYIHFTSGNRPFHEAESSHR